MRSPASAVEDEVAVFDGDKALGLSRGPDVRVVDYPVDYLSAGKHLGGDGVALSGPARGSPSLRGGFDLAGANVETPRLALELPTRPGVGDHHSRLQPGHRSLPDIRYASAQIHPLIIEVGVEVRPAVDHENTFAHLPRDLADQLHDRGRAIPPGVTHAKRRPHAAVVWPAGVNRHSGRKASPLPARAASLDQGNEPPVAALVQSAAPGPRLHRPHLPRNREICLLDDRLVIPYREFRYLPALEELVARRQCVKRGWVEGVQYLL